MKTLFVGDPHVVVPELKDCAALIKFVSEVAEAQRVDRIVFLGDQHHNHGLVSLDVMGFWTGALQFLGSKFPTLAMVGNHDKKGDGASWPHALLPYKGIPGVTIVDTFMELDGFLFLPHMDDDKEDLFRRCCEGAAKRTHTVVCHQTFQGSKYDNNFYAPGGFDLDAIPQQLVVSGHIHLPQELHRESGKALVYVGAPRWRSASDANVKRALQLLTTEGAGYYNFQGFDTGPVCRRIYDLLDVEPDPGQLLALEVGEPLVPPLEQVDPLAYDGSKDDVRVTIRGSEAYIRGKKAVMEEQGFKVRTVRTDEKVAPRVRESQGIATAFQAYAETFKPKNNTPKDRLAAMAKERLHA